MTAKALLFTSPKGCGPRKVMKPLVVETAKEAVVPFEIVEVGENLGLMRFIINTSVPAPVLWDENGGEIKRIVGSRSKKDIQEFFDK